MWEQKTGQVQAILQWCKQYRILIFFGLILIAVSVHWYIQHSNRHNQYLQVIALDVGQGSGVYIVTPGGVEILVDTGPTAQTLRALGKYRSFFDRSIDYLFLSHMDADHVGIAGRILQTYHPRETFTNIHYAENQLAQSVLSSIQQHSQLVTPVSGDRRVLDAHTYVEFLHPDSLTNAANKNDNSLVMRIVYGQTSILLTGDISDTVEQELVEMYGPRLRSDILMISHHGSKTSTDAQFIAVVSPQYAVIQSGLDNRYGHPHRNTLNTLHDSQAQVVRTDKRGSVHFISNGKEMLLQ